MLLWSLMNMPVTSHQQDSWTDIPAKKLTKSKSIPSYYDVAQKTIQYSSYLTETGSHKVHIRHFGLLNTKQSFKSNRKCLVHPTESRIAIFLSPNFLLILSRNHFPSSRTISVHTLVISTQDERFSSAVKHLLSVIQGTFTFLSKEGFSNMLCPESLMPFCISMIIEKPASIAFVAYIGNGASRFSWVLDEDGGTSINPFHQMMRIGLLYIWQQW